jgi:hypothetical protein
MDQNPPSKLNICPYGQEICCSIFIVKIHCNDHKTEPSAAVCRLQVFENGMVSNVRRYEGEDMDGEWCKKFTTNY